MDGHGTNVLVYDGHNRRVKECTGPCYSFYSKSGKLLYRKMPFGGVNYIYLDNKLIAKDGYFIENSKQHYRPYGDSIEGEVSEVGFAGHKFDIDTELSYMQSRYYDPVIGRFYSNDPIEFRDVHSFNRYVYANNNPASFIDPDGRLACPEEIKNCVDDPASEKEPPEGDPNSPWEAPGGGDDSELLVIHGTKFKKFSDGFNIRFPRTGVSEQGFRVAWDGMYPIDFAESGIQNCEDGSTRAANRINLSDVQGGNIGHTHGGGDLDPLPGPEDGYAAKATGKSSYMISRRGAFAIENTAVGFRVRLLAGRNLKSKEKRKLRKIVAAYNKNGGGSGQKCTFTPNK